MSFQNRISSIQMRMQEIQSKFGSSPVNSHPILKAGQFKPGMTQPTSTTGVTFEQILATKMKTPTGGGTAASHVKNFALSSKSANYDSIINEAAQKYNVDTKFIKAIIQQESGFNPNATSWCGAMGMMQLMPETAKGLGVKNAYDPKDNIMGGVKYIKQQLDRFGGDRRKALAAYNAGPGAVLKHGGVPPYKETQNYVRNIMGMYQQMGGS